MMIPHTELGPRQIATHYIESVGVKRLDFVSTLLHPDLRFDGNFSPVAAQGPDAWLAALRRLAPVLVRNEIRSVVVEGSVACIRYDFVTTVCPVPSAEWLELEGGRIRSIYLLFDKTRWPEVLQDLQRTTQ